MKKFIPYIILMLSFLIIIPSQIFALTATEVRQQIEETNDQIEALDKEIKQYQSQIRQDK